MKLTLFSKVGLEREEKMSNSRAAVITCSEAVWLKLVILFVEVFGGFYIFLIYLFYIFISKKQQRESGGFCVVVCIVYVRAY